MCEPQLTDCSKCKYMLYGSPKPQPLCNHPKAKESQGPGWQNRTIAQPGAQGALKPPKWCPAS